MLNNFFKFPTTPHLLDLGSANIRDDKILNDRDRSNFLNQFLQIEEKIDGANLGISFNHDGDIILQNRGKKLLEPFQNQWKTLSNWINSRISSIFDAIETRYILFGEWCYATHSIHYTRLPDLFLAFDIYDKDHNQFLSIVERDIILKKIPLHPVPFLNNGLFEIDDIIALISQSKYSNEHSEGVYLRHDKGRWLQQRAKLVRPQFTQSITEHWSRKILEKNIVIRS